MKFENLISELCPNGVVYSPLGTLCKIETGKLNANAIDNSFRDGTLKTTGTDFDRIMPPVSRFGGGSRTEKKQGIIRRLSGFFEKYLGVA